MDNWGLETERRSEAEAVLAVSSVYVIFGLSNSGCTFLRAPAR
jgi:hypothetical protein